VLERLRVKDLALIEQLEFEPGPGLNLITGETGSGKSILLDALGFVLGARASVELIRSQADSVLVSAEFAPPETFGRKWAPWLEEHGLPEEAGRLFLKRELHRGGKGRAWINGEPAPVGLLAELGEALVDFHGQHDHQALLRVHEHREILDRFGGHDEELRKVAAAWETVRIRREALEGPAGDPSARRRQLELLEFQAAELEELNPVAGEWANLRAQAGLQAGAGRRAEAFGRAQEALEGEDGGALARLGEALSALRRAAESDPGRRPLVETVERAESDLREVAAELRAALEGIEFSPQEQERVQNRLHRYETLARRHQRSPEELSAIRADVARERDALRALLEDEAGLKAALDKARESYAVAAAELTAARERAAGRLIKALNPEVRSLVGANALFTVSLKPREDASGEFSVGGKRCRGDRFGVDDVEFLFAPNPGEAPKSLARIASGGELSRIALGLKTVFSRQEGAPSLVFDEIDAGIGGRVAELVGGRIAALARRHQVLCITHLPQIASLPGRHFRVSKRFEKTSTVTGVEVLDAAGRETEVAAMLGTGAALESARTHARELLGRFAGDQE
jgi:DNA repair protein RecN (Recombination protein N)